MTYAVGSWYNQPIGMNDTTLGYARSSDPYLKKLKRRKAFLGLAVAAGVVAALAVVALFAVSAIRDKAVPVARQEEVLELWRARDYQSVRAACQEALGSMPLDPFYLSLNGYAAFYLSLAEGDAEARSKGMDEAVFSIRKALIAEAAPLRAESSYILGKAYFHKGVEYYPDAIDYIEEARRLDLVMADTWEYLALAAAGVGRRGDAAGYFEKAMEAKPGSPELALAAALNAREQGDADRAEALALAARGSSTDDFLTERCDFMLGELLLEAGRPAEALALFEGILARNPESADAWYRQGLVHLQSGDALKARAAWRKAISIDPMHAAARQKLSERS